MIILLAVIALVVVNALRGSPWGAFTILATMPIAIFMGLYLRYWRPGQVLEVSVIGFVLVLLSIFGGQAVSQSPTLAPWFDYSAMTLAIGIIVYGFAASALPVWLLLAPRDYLSTFVKLGVVILLGFGILLIRPQLELPALTRFVDGTGPIFAGKIFPFCFITIACGAISGFHSLISSGTTPKLIARETTRAADRLRRHGARELRRHHGAHRRVRAAARRVLRRQLAGAASSARPRRRPSRPSPAGGIRSRSPRWIRWPSRSARRR